MSASVALERAGTAERVRALPADPDVPPDARVWIKGRLLDLSEMPLPARLWYGFKYRVLRIPPPEFYDLKTACGSRARARAKCRDSLDYIVALPYERELGRKAAEDPTFCRPLWGPDGEKDREHAERYAEDLTEHFSAVNLAACRQFINEMERQREVRAKLA